jgi:pyrroline-5-carboxylate reductase
MHMKKITTVTVLGCGNMGRALAQALSRHARFSVRVYDIDRRKTKGLRRVSVVRDIPALIKGSDVLLVAVKPQDIAQFLDQSHAILLRHRPLVVSIVAGIPTTVFERRLKGVKVVRAMPNLPAQVGKSVTFLCAGRHAARGDVRSAQEIFSCVGRVFVTQEKSLDKVTSLSGSGPGYIYYMMECMYRKACRMGFLRKEAREMVFGTFEGAIELAHVSKKDFSALVRAVSSPRGTTEAALEVFKKYRIEEIFSRGIDQAVLRAKVISRAYRK